MKQKIGCNWFIFAINSEQKSIFRHYNLFHNSHFNTGNKTIILYCAYNIAYLI